VRNIVQLGAEVGFFAGNGHSREVKSDSSIAPPVRKFQPVSSRNWTAL
jgi:hypothetical protein